MGSQQPWRAVSRTCIGASIAAALLAAGCGGGGGSGGGEAQAQDTPPPAYLQSRITMAEYATTCPATTRDCVYVGDVSMDEAGAATIFWSEGPPFAQPGGYAAMHLPGGGVQGRIWVADSQGVLSALALGNGRFAVLEQETSTWTSALVDWSTPSSPSVSPRVSTLVDRSEQWVSGPGGAFALGTTVASGPIPLGGAATAQGVNVQLPAGYRGLWFSTFDAATSVTPVAWWAFNAAEAGSVQQHVYLARMDLPGGTVPWVVRRSLEAWRSESASFICGTPGQPKLTVGEHGIGNVAVGWIHENASASGCDVFVDGVALTGQGASAFQGPVLGASGGEPVAVWEESDLSGSRLVWRQRNAASGQWSAATRLSSAPFVHLGAHARAPNGALAIAWSGCDTSNADTCVSYVSKYLNGTWSTQQFTERSGLQPYNVRLAINTAGQAIVAWSRIQGEKCSGDASKSCARVSALRF